MSELKTVILLGPLGKRFGRRHRYAIKNPAEAVRALKANFPGFEGELIRTGNENIGHRVIVGREPVRSDSELAHPSSFKTITIAPVVAGAGGNIGKIFIGAALVAASFIIAPYASPFIASAFFGVGVSLALGGVAQMIAGDPSSDGPNEADSNTPSYAFNGAVNTTQQGHPVPVGYGRLIVGSQIISAGISARDVV